MKDFSQYLFEMNEPLLEGRDAPLFHWTTALFEILATNALKAGGLDEIFDHKTISLTRDLNTPYFNGRPSVLVLNQTKLAQRYKMEPLFGDAITAMRIKRIKRNVKPESEERVTTGKIAPLDRYLLAIGVSKNDLMMSDDAVAKVGGITNDMVHIMLLAAYSQKFNIPIVPKQNIQTNGKWSKDISDKIIHLGKLIKKKFEDETVERQSELIFRATMADVRFSADIINDLH